MNSEKISLSFLLYSLNIRLPVIREEETMSKDRLHIKGREKGLVCWQVVICKFRLQ